MAEQAQAIVEKDEVYTLEETAELLKLSRYTIVREVNRGNLAGAKMGKQWRFTRQDINKYLKKFGSTGLDPTP